MKSHKSHNHRLSKLHSIVCGFSRGIAIFEMTVLTLSACMILTILAQGTLLFTRAAEVRNLAHLGTRYAAANPGYDITTIKNYILQSASPTIGANGGSALNITISPATTPRLLGSTVTVTVAYTYDQSRNFGAGPLGLHFPSTLSSTESGATE